MSFTRHLLTGFFTSLSMGLIGTLKELNFLTHVRNNVRHCCLMTETFRSAAPGRKPTCNVLNSLFDVGKMVIDYSLSVRLSSDTMNVGYTSLWKISTGCNHSTTTVEMKGIWLNTRCATPLAEVESSSSMIVSQG